MRKKLVFVFILGMSFFIMTSCAKAPGVREVEEAYQKAMEALFWFEVETMPGVYDAKDPSTYREADGMTYSKVTHNTIKSYSDLKKYLASLFSDDMVTMLLNRDNAILYRDFDGQLFAIPAGRGTDISKGKETVSVVKENNEKYKCLVEVELLDWDGDATGTEEHKFIYERYNGKWVFTNIYVFR